MESAREILGELQGAGFLDDFMIESILGEVKDTDDMTDEECRSLLDSLEGADLLPEEFKSDDEDEDEL